MIQTNESVDNGAIHGIKNKLQHTQNEVNQNKKIKVDNPDIITSAIAEDDMIESNTVAHDTSITDSVKARLLFQWLIAPMKVEEFYEKYWEKKPLLIRRKQPDYYKEWFNKEEFKKIIDQHMLQYGEDIDLTSFKDNVKTNLNPLNVDVHSKFVWKQFKEKKASIRLLCPQQFSDPMWKLLSILEDEFGCMTGSNAYYTPAESQGFAPHFDDIEAFVIQVEGKKRWRIYEPDINLPRYSSQNFKIETLPQPIIDEIIEEGDLLFFPRGYIHQAITLEKDDSLHVTISTGQQNSYADFLEMLIPKALASVIEENDQFRRLLPKDYLNYMGVIHSDKSENVNRKKFISFIKSLLEKVTQESLDILDPAADQMAKKNLIDRLPPMLEDDEEECTVERTPLYKITINSCFRLIRAGVVRLTIEDGKAVVYHCLVNSRKHHENPISPLEFELDDAESIEMIIQSYPNYFCVNDLPLEEMEDKISLTKAFYDEGLLQYEIEDYKK